MIETIFINTLKHDISQVVKDAEKDALVVINAAPKLIRIIESGEQLSPELKQELSQLITHGEALAAILAPVVASGGLNAVVDLAAIAPAFSHVVTITEDFISLLKTIDAIKNAS